MPGDCPTRTMWCWEYAASTLICSIARAVRKQAAAETNGILPPFASPAPTHHVLLGDADVDQALGEPLLERTELAGTDRVVDDRDDPRSSPRRARPSVGPRRRGSRAVPRWVRSWWSSSLQFGQRLGDLLAVGALGARRCCGHERDRVALHGVGDHRGRLSRGRRHAGERVEERPVVVSVDVDDLEAERGQLVGEGLEVVGVLDPRPLLEAVAVDDDAQVRQPVVAAVISASQLEPSCSSPSPTTTKVRRAEPSSARRTRFRRRSGARGPAARCWPRRRRSWSGPGAR